MNKLLNHLEEAIITFLMGAATVIIFLSVVHRYLSGYDIPGLQDWLLSLNFSWAQELCIIMFVWMAKYGAAYGVRTGIHVGVDVVINRLKTANRAKFVLFGLLAGATFTGIVGTLGATFVWETAPTTSSSTGSASKRRTSSKAPSRRTWNGRPGSSIPPCPWAPT